VKSTEGTEGHSPRLYTGESGLCGKGKSGKRLDASEVANPYGGRGKKRERLPLGLSMY